jgi:hypothetical protein
LLKVPSKGLRTLHKADTAITNALKKSEVLAPDHKEENYGCLNQLYYYGYLELNEIYLGAVFGYSICSCCGDDQLLLVVVDSNGMVKSAIVAAEFLSPSECNMETTTQINGPDLVVQRKDECGILEGPDNGKSSIDSCTTYYHLAKNGKLTLKSSKKVTLIR